MNRFLCCGLLVTGIIIHGCSPKFTVLALSEKTALENQVLGTYDYLTDDDRFWGSVPGVDTRGAIETPQPQGGVPATDLPLVRRNVLKAVLHQEFQREDILRFKASGYVGENSSGYLFAFKERIPEDEYNRVERMVSDENTDRKTVVDGVIAVNTALSQSDRPKVEAVFARQYREGARPGDWYETSAGNWQQVK